MKPNFTHAVNWQSTEQVVDKFATIMDSFVSEIKKRDLGKHKKSLSHTNYVSSNLPIQKSKKNIMVVMDGNSHIERNGNSSMCIFSTFLVSKIIFYICHFHQLGGGNDTSVFQAKKEYYCNEQSKQQMPTIIL